MIGSIISNAVGTVPLFLTDDQSAVVHGSHTIPSLAAANANFPAFNRLQLSPSPENCRFLRRTIGGENQIGLAGRGLAGSRHTSTVNPKTAAKEMQNANMHY